MVISLYYNQFKEKCYIKPKEKYYDFFNKFQLILLCLIVLKIKKLLQNILSAIVINNSLRIIFRNNY